MKLQHRYELLESLKRIIANKQQYWCWIGPRWLVLRIMGEYIWLWLALVASFVLYFMLALWWRSAVPQENMDGPKARSKENRLAYDMLAYVMLCWSVIQVHILNHFHKTRYPLTYAILVLPLTIVRWMTFGTSIGVPSAATVRPYLIFLCGPSFTTPYSSSSSPSTVSQEPLMSYCC
jgi:hypothetical protein